MGRCQSYEKLVRPARSPNYHFHFATATRLGGGCVGHCRGGVGCRGDCVADGRVVEAILVLETFVDGVAEEMRSAEISSLTAF